MAVVRLMAVMTEAIQVAKNAVLAVDEAWLRLEPTLANAEAEITVLQKLANSLGVTSIGELSDARQKNVLLDPVSCVVPRVCWFADRHAADVTS